MRRRLLTFAILIILLLILSPAWGDFSLSGISSLDTFNHDLDNAHLTLENLNADWQLTPSAGNKLTVKNLRAKRMIITMKENIGITESGLPEQIKLPFPIKVQHGEIAEVVVITKNQEHSLTNVKFSFDGTAKLFKLNLKNAETTLGKVNAAIDLATASPFTISGKVTLNKTDGSVPYNVEALLSGDLETLHVESESLLTRMNNQVALIQANEKSLDPVAQILTHIDLGLVDDYPIKLTTRINALRPERLGNYPTAELNFNLNLQGNLLPQPDLRVNFSSHESHWQNQALSSHGELSIKNGNIRDINLQAALLDSKFSAKGDLNQPNSTLKWQLNLPNLAVFGAGYSGQAYASGSVEDTFENLALQFNLKSEKLKITDILKSNSLDGQATLISGEKGKLDVEFNTSHLQYTNNPAVDGTLRIEGTRKDHQIKLAAHNQEFKLESNLKGGLISLSNWQGVIQSFSLQGDKTIVLEAPAPFIVSPNKVSLQNASIRLKKGQAIIESLQYDAFNFSSKGQLRTFAIEDLPTRFVNLPSQFQSNLAVSGTWDIKANDTVDGELHFWRESGDVALKSIDNKPLALGLNEAEIKAVFLQNQVTLDVKIEGNQLGSLNTHLVTTLNKTNNGYALLTSAPLKLSSSAQLHTLLWLPLSDGDIDGQLTLNMQAVGTIHAPNLSGTISGKNLQLSLLSEGVSLTEGTVESSFVKDKLVIHQAKWKGGEGYVTTNGSIGLDNNKPEVMLDWKAEKFTALSRTDRLLTLSGSGKTILVEDLLTIAGNFTADKGFIQLAEEGTPKLGGDVIILGKAESTPEANLKMLLNDLRIDLGNDFIIRGQGIDAELTGAVTLSGLSQYQPHAEGSIQVKKGTYLAYGQTLVIEEGRFNFSGPIDNPGINLRAMRNSTPINAGIEITGSAYVPVTKLISEPSVPDSEKLSWLVLGHGMDQTGKDEFAVLSLAAGAILSHGESVPLQTRLARAAGLDEFSFSGGDSESTALTLGKRLSSKLYLSYQKSINGLLDIARLTFNITPSWSVRAESGTESAVDVLYTFSFE